MEGFCEQFGLSNRTTDLCVADFSVVPRRGLLSLLHDQRYCDVSFIVDGQCFPAHKVIVAAQSEFFDRLLYGPMKESQCKEVALKDIPSGAFEILLEYMYGGAIGKVDIQTALDLLGLADRFDFQDLKVALEKHLCSITNIAIVLCFLYYAELFNACELHRRCVNIVDSNAEALLASEELLALPQDQFSSLISRDTFLVDELCVFKAVQRWKHHNGKTTKEMASLLKCVRLSEISSTELADVVQPSGLYCEGAVSTAIEAQKKTASEPTMSPRGKKGLNLFQDPTTSLMSCSNYWVEETHDTEGHANPMRELIFQLIPSGLFEDCSITFEFDGVYLVNELKFDGLSVKQELEPYSYVVDVSRDCLAWHTVVDHSCFRCYGTQHLYFPNQAAKYIRLTQKKGRGLFKLRFLSCSCSSSVPFIFASGILAPTAQLTPVHRQYVRNDGSYVRCFVFFHQPYSISLLRFKFCSLDGFTGHFVISVASRNKARAYTVISSHRHHNFDYEVCATFAERPVCIVSITLTNLHLKPTGESHKELVCMGKCIRDTHDEIFKWILQSLKDVSFTAKELFIGQHQ